MSFPLCFPETSKISTSYNSSLSITNLQLGQKVSDSSKDYFLGYIHYEPETFAKYLEISCENGRRITLSEEHLIFKQLENSTQVSVPAGEIKLGDSLIYHGNGVAVVSIKTVTCMGVYAPLSTSGTLVINGFLVSCYAHVKSHEFAHKGMGPLRFWLQNVRKVHKNKKNQAKNNNQEGIHGYARVLMKFQNLMPGIMA